MSAFEPQPGDIFLTQIGGAVGLSVRIGQAVAGDFSRYTHAGIVLDNGQIIAGQPGGARIDPIETIIDDRPLAFMSVPQEAHDRRDAIVSTARRLEGYRYGFESYLWIALARLGLQPDWLRRLVSSDTGLICSAFADYVWLLNGIHLFDDGRMEGEVTPGDLAHVGWTFHYDTGPYITGK